jgi:peptidoglycan/LPS O-acetylase OafA/YrhL
LLLITVIIEFAIRGLRYPYVLGLDIPVINQMVALTKTWFFPTRIFWFALGIVVGFNLQVFKTKLIRIKWGLLIAVVLLFVIGMIEWELLLRLSGQDWIAPWETIIDGLYALAFLLAFLAFDNINIPFSEKVGELGSKSYGIYLIHSLVLLYTSKVVYQIAPKILEFQIIFQSLLILMGLGVPLALMAFVNKTTYRKYYKYIFG